MSIWKHIPYWVAIIVLGGMFIFRFGPTNQKTVVSPNGVSSPVEVKAYGGCQTLEQVYDKKV